MRINKSRTLSKQTAYIGAKLIEKFYLNCIANNNYYLRIYTYLSGFRRYIIVYMLLFCVIIIVTQLLPVVMFKSF